MYVCVRVCVSICVCGVRVCVCERERSMGVFFVSERKKLIKKTEREKEREITIKLVQ